LLRRFGHIDEPEHAKRRFDSKKQLESETIEVFEQGLRTMSLGPLEIPSSRKMTRCFSVISLMVSFMRLSSSSFVFTRVAKARQFMDA